MQREYDDEIFRDYFNVSVMDVATALMDKIELLYSTDYETEVMDDGEKEFDGADLGDYSRRIRCVDGQRGRHRPRRGDFGSAVLRTVRTAAWTGCCTSGPRRHVKNGNEEADCTGIRQSVSEKRENRMSELHSVYCSGGRGAD
eukprot:XP_016663296.1 PREDICTED: uncharacterized protein LOC107884848 [Acyrthosiphon pisum]